MPGYYRWLGVALSGVGLVSATLNCSDATGAGVGTRCGPGTELVAGLCVISTPDGGDASAIAPDGGDGSASGGIGGGGAGSGSGASANGGSGAGGSGSGAGPNGGNGAGGSGSGAGPSGGNSSGGFSGSGNSGGFGTGGFGTGGSGAFGGGGGVGGTPAVSGVTCEVELGIPDGNGVCSDSTTTTYQDVPFEFAGGFVAEGLPPVGELTSALYAFELLAGGPPRFIAQDKAATSYVLAGTPIEVTRRGLVVEAQGEVVVSGGECNSGPRPLIRVSCAGTALLAPPGSGCWPVPDDLVASADFDGPPLACIVRRRDSNCSESSTSGEPRVWLAPGAHGNASELHTDFAPLAEILGSNDGVGRFYQDYPCQTYAVDSSTNIFDVKRLSREGNKIAVRQLLLETTETCPGDLGRPTPVLSIECSGAATLDIGP